MFFSQLIFLKLRLILLISTIRNTEGTIVKVVDYAGSCAEHYSK